MNALACNWPVIQGGVLWGSHMLHPMGYLSRYIGVLVPLFLGIFVYVRNRHQLIGSVFLALALSVAGWTLLDAYRLFSNQPSLIMFSFAAQVVLYMVIAYCSYLFCHLFVVRQPVPHRVALGLAVPLAIPLLLAATPYLVAGFDFTNCSRTIIEGMLFPYMRFYILMVICAHLYLLYWVERGVAKTHVPYRQLLVIPGAVLLIVSFFIVIDRGALGNHLDGLRSYIPALRAVILFFISYLVLFTESGRRQTRNILNTRVLIPLVIIATSSLLVIEDQVLLHNSIIILCVIIFCVGYIIDRLLHRQIDFEGVLEQKNTQLEDLGESKTQFLAFTSDHMRAPVASIVSSMMALRETKLTAEQQAIVNQTLGVAGDMTHTVSEFLVSAEVESGQMELKRVDTDIVALVQRVIDNLQSLADRKGLRLSIIALDDHVTATIDPEKIQQVVTSLVHNALTYTTSGSVQVTISLRSADEGQGVLSPMVRITVSDTGPGIAPEEASALFARFHRGAAGQINPHGSGIGLYLVRQIIELHGGTVAVHSEGIGRGSQFIVEFPTNN